ncbi:MAG TPA: branched-chain amino acid ABC transporter substrate-binding protein [Candidatus Limnocylindrales bacterium]
MKLTKVGAIASTAVIALSACGGGGASKTVKFAIELPLQGSELAASQPIINGIKLAVKQAGNKVAGYTIDIPQSAVKDDALNGVHDPQTGANNMTQIVGDDSVVAVIGPLNSSVAKAQIPISNAAGLPQCSPANTNPDLTKGAPAAQLRTKPNNYVRIVTTDDVQGPAASQYIYDKLGKKSVYIIDSTDTFGKGVADAFEADFKQRGGTVVKHDGAPKTTQDYVSILTAAKALNPEAIYFGGVTADGGARILLAAAQVGLGDVPFVGPDGINDGSAQTKDSFLNLAGDKAKNAYSTLAGIGDYPGKAKFDADYKAEYGIDATGYAGQGFTCAQVMLDALGRAAATNPADNKALRAAILTALADTRYTYKTIQGDFTFDANGDTSQKIVSIYSYDATAKDWKFQEQVDYASK